MELEIRCRKRGSNGMWQITIARGGNAYMIMAMNDQECNALLEIIEAILEVVATEQFKFTGEFPPPVEEALAKGAE